jgi:PIN domain nuclease of toxin-antitoxin system
LSLLLDSHVFLWFDHGDPRLPVPVRNRINATQEVFVSAATIWELSIKRSLGKLPGIQGTLVDIVRKNELSLLAISAEHAEEVAGMPRHHGDPFDHLLLAQAKVEGLTLVTHDDILRHYGVPVLLV